MELSDDLGRRAKMNEEGSWYTRFLAGCITLASSSLSARPADLSSSGPSKNRFTIARYESVARFTNMIVSGLWDDWHEKAFLVYHAFAGEPQFNV